MITRDGGWLMLAESAAFMAVWFYVGYRLMAVGGA